MKTLSRTRISSFMLVGSWCVLVSIGAHSAFAGGRENTFVVFNAGDQASLTIANHYQNLRKIPASNLFGIEWRGTRNQIPVNTFRREILSPLLNEIDRRKLSGQIDYVVYSSGFPYAVDFSQDFPGKAPKFSVASLTAMTYFYQNVLAKQVYYASVGSNRYADTRLQSSATKSFQGASEFSVNSDALDGPPQRYLLSAMLGYTDGRGNTVDEVVRYLTSAAAADGTFPKGVIYFMENSDIRAKTRKKQFEPVVAALSKIGVHAEIEQGDVPFKKNQVAGVMAGVANFKWGVHNSRIVPGAFCDNLTSFGGVLRKGAGQTPLSEFLRFGAAGASGAVVEPFAIADKFPHASLYLHYTRGLSLGEAFFRSVKNPYQLLLVGDPLCRPWSDSPTFSVVIEGDSNADGSVSGRIRFRPSSLAYGLRYELFVDGRFTGTCVEGQHLRLDSRNLPDGYHDIRVAGIRTGAIESRGSKLLSIVIDNNGWTLDASVQKQTHDEVLFNVVANGGDGIQAWCRRRLVGVLNNSSGQLKVRKDLLGNGPARVHFVAISSRNRRAVSFARPIELKLAAPSQHTQNNIGSLR